jgi:hypothetical protein
MDLLGIGLLEDGADERADHGLGGLGHLDVDVAHEMDPAVLPGRTGAISTGPACDQTVITRPVQPLASGA